MGWETRRNGLLYFYQKRRENGRIVSDYRGCGPGAELLALELELSAQDRAAMQREREPIRELERQVDQATSIINQVVAATLVATGYHQHKGMWRRQRVRAIS